MRRHADVGTPVCKAGARKFFQLFAVLAIALLLVPVGAVANVEPASLENDVMCVTCGRPLAQSSGAAPDEERAFIAQLARKGLTKDQIKAQLVDQYGKGVLIDNHDPMATIAPAAALIVGAIVVALMVRRRRGTPGRTDETPSPLTGDDDERIDAELAGR
jgi:cytochrome c-type biogenesis protein CcmH/NrfF